MMKLSSHLNVVLSFCILLLMSDMTKAQFNPTNPLPLPSVPIEQPGQGGGGIPTFPLPTNPPTNPTNPPPNPGFPWLPGQGNTNPGSGGITINYTCPLLDQEGAGDLMASLDVLAKALPAATPSCNQEVNFEELNKKQLEMRSTGKEISEFWNKSKDLWGAGKTEEEYLGQINGFGKNVSTLMSDIKYITESLGKNELLESNCGKELMSKGKALHALSDLVMQVSPYAIFAANAGASMTVIGPVVSGFAGIASLIKTISKTNENGLIDINIPDNRLMIMKATCEYLRIEGKLRVIRLAKIENPGQADGVNKLTQLIDSQDEAIKNINETLFNSDNDPVLSEIFERRKQFYEKTKEIRTELKKDWVSFNEYDQFRVLNSAEEDLCNLGNIILENKDNNEFPYNLQSNIDKLKAISMKPETLAYRNAKLRLSSLLDQLSNIKNTSFGAPGLLPGIFPSQNQSQIVYASCGTITKDAINGIAKFLEVFESALISVESDLEMELQKNSKYKSWYMKNASLIKDRDNLKKIVNVIKREASQIDKPGLSELSLRMEELRHSLFGTKESLPLINFRLNNYLQKEFGIGVNTKSRSPIGSWFSFMANKHAEFISFFNKSLELLLSETKDELNKYLERSKKEKREKPSLVTLLDSRKKSNIEILKHVSLETFPENDSQNKVMCRRLRDVALHWQSAMEHLDNMKNFCNTIKDYIDTRTGDGIVSYCGIDSINRRASNITFISERENELEKMRLPYFAQLIKQKYQELKCF